MKQKHLTLLCALSLCLGNLKAQTETFNLSDYVRPDFKNHILNSNFLLNQNKNNTQSFNLNSDDQTFSSYNGQVQLSYFGVKNNKTWQKETAINTDFSFQRSYYSSTFNGSTDERTALTSNTEINSSLRKYYSPTFFLEVDYLLRHKFSQDKTVSKFMGNESIFKTKNSDLIFYAPIKFGFGRVENVSDARHAIFIIDALKKNQSLSRDLSHEEILEFAAMITDLKNKRFFDFRLRRIAELKALHAFLKSKNILLNTEIEYYTMLNDRWSFGNRALRKNGSRFSFAMYPGYNRTRVSSDFFSGDYITNAYNFQGGLEYVFEKPINQNWQNSTSAYMHIGRVSGTTRGIASGIGNDFEITINIPKFIIGFNQTFGFFPDTRTSMRYTLGFQYDSYVNKIDPQEGKQGFDGERFFIENKLDITYFVSPRFSVSVFSNTNFVTFLTSEVNFQVRNEILLFSHYLNCQNSNCGQFLASKKRNQFNFGISMAYSLF